MELFIYLLKASGCTAAFYLLYHNLFRKFTFFNLNRWYLLSTLIISLAIPLLHIDIQTLAPAPDVKPLVINTIAKTIESDTDPVVLQQPAKHINWEDITLYAYYVVTALLLVKFLVSLASIVYKALKYGKQQNGYRLISEKATDNSSFFHFVFVNDSGLNVTEREQVIAHELVHAKLLHSADHIFIAILKTTLWFNPFIYLYSTALHQAHEFEVDSHIANKYNSKTYASLLLKLSMPASRGISNQFSAYGLKSRVNMLFRAKSAKIKRLTYLAFLPVMAALVYFLAVNKVYAYTESSSMGKNFVLVLDAGHGGKQFGAVGADGTTEKALTLSIVKQIKAVAEKNGIKTILTRDADQDMALDARLKFAGDAFVSVHINSVSGRAKTNFNGIALLINKNSNYQASKQLAIAVKDQLKQLSGINTANDITENQHIKVLRDNSAPAMLLELGYLSNENDLKYLNDPTHQTAIAQKFVDAIIAFKSIAKPKMGKAIIKPDTGLRVKVDIAFALHQKNQSSTSETDTAKRSRSQNINWGKTIPVKGKFQSLKIFYSNDDGTEQREALSADFKNMRYSAKDSTRTDNKGKVLHLYGDVTVTTHQFQINAKAIRYDLKDSLLTAIGKVTVQIKEAKDVKYSAPMEVDSLTIDLKTHIKKRI